MTPHEIIRAEYGHAPNIMTPEVTAIGALPGGAYELSIGTGMENEPIFGVSVVYLTSNGTRRSFDDSKLFFSLADAREYVRKLKEAPVASFADGTEDHPW